MAGDGGADSGPWLSQAPPPGDSGKPMALMPPPDPAPVEPSRCLPALPCGTQIYGAVQKNGGIAVEVPALRW